MDLEPEGVSELVLAVEDLRAAEAFYSGILGLSVVRRARHRVWVQAGRTRIGLWSAHPEDEDLPEDVRLHRPVQEGVAGARGGVHVHFALRVPPAELDAFLARVEGGGVHPREIHREGRARAAFLDDPDGNVVEVTDASPEMHLPHGLPKST